MTRQHDLRLARLAIAFEETIENYEETLRDGLGDARLHAGLKPLFDGSNAHMASLRDAIKRLGQGEEGVPAQTADRDALDTVRECEVLAQEFYKFLARRTENADLKLVLSRLRDEERVHEAVVQRLLKRQEAPTS